VAGLCRRFADNPGYTISLLQLRYDTEFSDDEGSFKPDDAGAPDMYGEHF
jgi:hypothetical protein